MQEYLLQMGYTLSADRNSVTISEDGSLQAVGFRPSVIYADNGRGSCFAIAEVTIETPSYSQEYVTRAVGSKATAVGVPLSEVAVKRSLMQPKIIKWLFGQRREYRL